MIRASLAAAVLAAVASCHPGEPTLANPPISIAEPAPAPPSLTRLLAGPLSSGVPWEVVSEWHAVPLASARPELGLPARSLDDFESGETPLPHGWISTRELQERSSSTTASTAPLARVVASPPGHALELGAKETLALRIWPMTSATNCAVSLKIRGDRRVAEERRLFCFDVFDDFATVKDVNEVARKIAEGGRIGSRRVVGFGLKPRGEGDNNLYLEPDVTPAGEDGFEQWRFEFEAGFGARTIALAVLGSAAGAIEIDDVALHVLPARALLGLEPGRLASFDLPRPWENGDRDLRATKVRLDWESRRALLLPPGAQASCTLAAPAGGARIELGLGIVREERLLLDGPLRIAARALAIVRARGTSGMRELSRRSERIELRLEADAATLWRELRFDLPALPDGVRDAELELRVEIDGSDDPLGPLVALGSPSVRALGTPRDGRRNVLLISLDTLRADRIGRKGPDGSSITPNLDRLAAESLVFTKALANSSYTLPSHVSLFTSQRPGVHGVLFFDTPFSPERSPNFAQLLAKQGWLTAGFTSGGMLNAEFCGIDLGFDRFGEIDAMLTPTDSLRTIAPLRDRPEYNRSLGAACRLDAQVLPWIAAHRDEPFLLFLHTYLVHDYQPEPELLARFTRGLPPTPLRITGPIARRGEIGERAGHNDMRYRFDGPGPGPHEFVPSRDLPWIEALYDATVAQADRDVGRLLQQIDSSGLRERTLVVVTADHGEEFLEHGDLGHARTLFDEILSVPLLVRIPGVAPRRIDAPTELIDVAPTLLAKLNVAADPRMQGRDALSPDWEERVTIHEGIEAGVAGSDPSLRKTLRGARGRGAKLVTLQRLDMGLQAVAVSDDALHQLELLGYVGSGVPEGGFFDLRSDPGELHDLALSKELDPKQRSQLQELLRQLEAAPAQPPFPR